MDLSDGGERTKEEGIGDSLVMSEEKKQHRSLKSYSTTSCQSYKTTVELQKGRRRREGESKGGKVEYDFDPD